MPKLEQTYICPRCFESHFEDYAGRLKCRLCGYEKPAPIQDSEKILLEVASAELRLSNFIDAEEKFLDAASKCGESSLAYWGAFLARYGVRYEQDIDGRMVPTCNSLSHISVYDNAHYKKAIELASIEERATYESEAKRIEDIRREWFDKASRLEPYDVFICFKASEDGKTGVRTEDYNKAYDLYNYLGKLGYRVFFAPASLKEGTTYEPYIYAALKSAKAMLVYASKPEYVTATWVKNEWYRYCKMIGSGEKQKNSLLVICDGLDPYLLPSQLTRIQHLDRKAVDFSDRLTSYLSEVLSKPKPAKPVAHNEPPAPDPAEVARQKRIQEERRRQEEARRQERLRQQEEAQRQQRLAALEAQRAEKKKKRKKRVLPICISVGALAIVGIGLGVYFGAIHPNVLNVERGTKENEEVPTMSSDGKTLTYGMYPQSNVSDKELLSALEQSATPEPNGWYSFDGGYYVKEIASPYDSSYKYSNGASVSGGTTYWFKCEPIEWRVLSNKDGEYFVVSKVLLDARRYDENSNSYTNSEIRSWINGYFYSTAFAFGSSYILTTTVDNSATSTGYSPNQYACEDTDDKVFLLSYAETTDSSYGFSPSGSFDSSKGAETTDYALAKGAYQSNGEGWWCLRSPNPVYSNAVGYVSDGGLLLDPILDDDGHIGGTLVSDGYYGVRPAIRIKL